MFQVTFCLVHATFLITLAATGAPPGGNDTQATWCAFGFVDVSSGLPRPVAWLVLDIVLALVSLVATIWASWSVAESAMVVVPNASPALLVSGNDFAQHTHFPLYVALPVLAIVSMAVPSLATLPYFIAFCVGVMLWSQHVIGSSLSRHAHDAALQLTLAVAACAYCGAHVVMWTVFQIPLVSSSSSMLPYLGVTVVLPLWSNSYSLTVHFFLLSFFL